MSPLTTLFYILHIHIHIPYWTLQPNYPATVFLPHWTTSTFPRPVINPEVFILRNLGYNSCKSQGKLKNCQTERHNHMIPDPRLGTFARSHWDNRQNLNRMSKWRGLEGSLTILLPMCFWKIKLLWYGYKMSPTGSCDWSQLVSLGEIMEPLGSGVLLE